MTDNNCFNCGNEGSEFLGYFICENCKAQLKLFTGKTVKRYLEIDPVGFPKEIERRLEALEKDYIKKRIKLLHIQDSIN